MTVEMTIRHGTVGDLAPEFIPHGYPPEHPCAVARRGERMAFVAYSPGLREETEGFDAMVEHEAAHAMGAL